ncbi:MAG: 2-phosphosulfolactate phosphatase [Candidatus Kapabacteria bacterium]|nr:2-phosphosulfolactate phosphatase [Candidatus Kapabacteria bacterium]
MIDLFFTNYFPEIEGQFNNSVLIFIDVLRSSTTICAALYNGAKEVIGSETHEKAVQIYSSLSRESRFLGGERNCIKPSGFDAGNSPSEYSHAAVAGKTVIISTSNGTKTFNKARNALKRIVCGFVNIDAVFDYLKMNFIENSTIDKIPNFIILCAGTNGRFSYEDTICGGAVIKYLKTVLPESMLTDSADAARNLYNLHFADFRDFLKTRQHAVRLLELGFESDIDTAFTYNCFPVVPLVNGTSIKLAD